jgi:hypothetical protein
MKRRTLMVVVLALLGLLGLACLAGAAERLSLKEEIKLHPAPDPKDPYTLFYDIRVKSPGVIRMGVDPFSVSPDKDIPHRLVGIGLLRKGETKVIKQEIGGKEGGKLEYSIDALELERTRGEYRVIVSNFSRKHTLLAKLVVLYPGAEESGVASDSRRSDLSVGEIMVNEQGFLAVELKNIGDAPLPRSVWSKDSDAAMLRLEIDGKKWGASTLWRIDPRHALDRPGGRVIYTAHYKVTRPVKVRAQIDAMGQIREKDERNNIKIMMLHPRQP